MKGKNLFIYIIIFFILFEGILEAKTTKSPMPIITLGKIEAEISAMDNIPFRGKTSITLKPDEYLLAPGVNTLQLKFDFESQNVCGIEEECLVEIGIKKASPPDKWIEVAKEKKELPCLAKKLNARKEILTPRITQTEDEAKYLITVRSLFLGGATSEKKAVITIRRPKESSFIYTTIPALPLILLHDPSGDRSYSFISPEYTLTHIIGIDLGTVCSFAKQSKVEFSTPDKGKLIIKPYSKDLIELSYTPTKELTSSKVSDNPDLIGPGYGDIYFIAKNIPVKISYLRSHKEGLKLFFQIVSPKEKFFKEKFDIIELPAACLREPTKDHSLFGTWQRFGIDDEFRHELIRLTTGWDNNITLAEKEYLMDMGAERLSFDKKKIEKRYEQNLLAPMEFEVMTHLDPQFAKELLIPNENGLTNLRVIFNSKKIPSHKTFYTSAILDDDDCTDSISGDFFTYHVYIDKPFRTAVFITDKNNSISSKPPEYWTSYYSSNLIVNITIATADGKPINLPDKAIKGCLLQLDDMVLKLENPLGKYKISGLKSQSYNLLVRAEGFIDVSQKVEIMPGISPCSIDIKLIPENLLLYGTVKDISTNLGIKNAIIEVRDNNELIGTTTSDSSGNYIIFRLLPKVTYTITTIANGYETTETIIFSEINKKVINREIYLDKPKGRDHN